MNEFVEDFELYFALRQHGLNSIGSDGVDGALKNTLEIVEIKGLSSRLEFLLARFEIQIFETMSSQRSWSSKIYHFLVYTIF